LVKTPPRRRGREADVYRTGPTTGLTAALVGQAFLLAVLAGAVGLGPAGWLTGLFCGTATVALLAVGLRRSGTFRLGAANRVTLVRAVLVGAVAALVAEALAGPTHPGLLVAISVAALGLDGVDGWVARRTGTASRLGARFDMETDAFLILVLSVLVAHSVGAWVLAIGLARYVLLVAGWALVWLREPVPPRYWRKPVAATQGVVLAIAAAGVLPGIVVFVLVGAALVLLTESFGRDVWWLWSQQRGADPAPRLVRAYPAVPSESA
jgi:phosphatidylglycerophosphate synthase